MSAVTPADAAAVLNRIHAADPTVMPALIGQRVPCNRAIADDPTVQVGAGVRRSAQEDPEFVVGLLGILNGIFGIDERGSGFIGAEMDGDFQLTGFVVLPVETVQ